MKKQTKIIIGVSTLCVLLAAAVILVTGVPVGSIPGDTVKSTTSRPPDISVSQNAPVANSDVLVKIGDRSFTEQEIFGPDMIQFFDLKQKEYEFKQVRFRRFLSSFYLKEQADKQKVTIDEYVNKYITKGKDLTPTKAELDEFVRERNIPAEEIAANPQAADQIKDFLKFKKQQDIVEKLVAEWSKTQKIETFFQPPRLSVTIPNANSPTFGNPDAKVTIVEFSDFECPYCSRAAATVKEIKKKYKDKVLLVYKHMPLEMHQNARMLAKASICVEQLNKPSFWLFYDELFKNQEQLIDKKISVEDLVKKLKLNLPEFQQCMLAEVSDKLIEMDMQLGQQLGVNATPTFFINGRILQGAVPAEIMERVIEEELAKSGGQ